MRKHVAIGLLMLAALAGCASTPPLRGNEQLTVTKDVALPPPTNVDLTSASRPYVIGPLDTLTIDVYGVEDLTREVRVDASGNISIPLAGTVAAAGRTAEQVAAAIEQRLAQYIKQPQVSVNLKETVSQVVTVDGQVREPGLYPVIGRMTLMQAVARAKGVSEFAKLDDVVVLRTVGNQRMAALYNLQAIRRGTYADPEIYANDLVVVGESSSRRLFQAMLQVAPLLASPVIAILQSNN